MNARKAMPQQSTKLSHATALAKNAATGLSSPELEETSVDGTAASGPLFVLGLPRSFTSVVCSMLGQHPQMYAFPEMQLFLSETVSRWMEMCARAKAPLAHGVLRAVAELYFGEQTEATVKLASGWLRRRAHFTTGLLMEVLAAKVRPRLLVDKASIIAFRIEFLRRAYRFFPEARFIHLIRHPRGHGESVIKYLEERRKHGPLPASHWLLHLAAHPHRFVSERSAASVPGIDPQRGWYALHMNICEFLNSVPAAQQMRVRGEDVLANPDRFLFEIAAWLRLRTDPEAIEDMKHPERSPYACFGPPGARYGNDLFFLKDPTLRSRRETPAQTLDGPLSWRKDGQGIQPEVEQLAKQFGYQ